MRASYVLLSFLLLVFLSSVECLRGSNSSGGGRQSGRGNYPVVGQYASNPHPVTSVPSASSSALTKTQQVGRGIGAWGYIAIILTVIISGMVAYYFVILYPILCKKERMYDVMEMTTV